MTEPDAGFQSGPEPAPAPRRAAWRRTGRSLMRRIVGKVLIRWGARIGLTWLAIMALMAVFAPLLANSYPLLMKVNGQWSSPWLEHLYPQDAVLFIVFFAAIAILPWRRWRLRFRILTLLGVAVVASALCGALISAPKGTELVHERYRDASYRKGMDLPEVQQAYHALVPYSPSDNLRDKDNPRLQPPSLEHPLGTTDNGADLFAQMVYATRIALSIGFISVGIALAIGVVVGGLMGYLVGWVDLIGMRLVEIFDAIPPLFFMLMFVAAFGGNLFVMMAIIGATSWVQYAVFVRAEFLSLRHQDYVRAAQAMGLPLRSILFQHMLPNGLAPVLVAASFGIAGAVLAESILSFLEIGLTGMTSWGKLLSEALGVGGTFYWWLAIYPGLAIFLTVLAFTLLGEALRDAIDPKTVDAE
jgi:peptide/nickel transport system permease protein